MVGALAPRLTRWMLFGGRPTEACLGGRGGSGPLDGTRLPPARHRVDRCVGWSQAAHAAGYAHTCSNTIQPSTPHSPRGESGVSSPSGPEPERRKECLFYGHVRRERKTRSFRRERLGQGGHFAVSTSAVPPSCPSSSPAGPAAAAAAQVLFPPARTAALGVGA